MGLLACFGDSLGRWSGVEDLLVGCPVSGRDDPRSEDLVGCFVEPLPLHLDLRDRPTQRQVLERVRRNCLTAYAHASVPFERLVQLAGASGRNATSPLFDVFFQLETPKLAAPRWAEIDLKVRDLHSGGAVAPLSVRVSTENQEGDSYWEHHHAHFTRSEVAEIRELFFARASAMTESMEQNPR
jgi:non-ribosomal peptide synthetase component F